MRRFNFGYSKNIDTPNFEISIEKHHFRHYPDIAIVCIKKDKNPVLKGFAKYSFIFKDKNLCEYRKELNRFLSELKNSSSIPIDQDIAILKRYL